MLPSGCDVAAAGWTYGLHQSGDDVVYVPETLIRGETDGAERSRCTSAMTVAIGSTTACSMSCVSEVPNPLGIFAPEGFVGERPGTTLCAVDHRHLEQRPLG